MSTNATETSVAENKSPHNRKSSSPAQLKGWIPTAREFERFLEIQADPYEAAILRHFNKRSHGFTRKLKPESFAEMAKALPGMSRCTIIRRLKAMREKGWVNWEPHLSQRVLPPRLLGRNKGVAQLTGRYHDVNTYAVIIPFVSCDIQTGVVADSDKGCRSQRHDTTCRPKALENNSTPAHAPTIAAAEFPVEDREASNLVELRSPLSQEVVQHTAELLRARWPNAQGGAESAIRAAYSEAGVSEEEFTAWVESIDGDAHSFGLLRTMARAGAAREFADRRAAQVAADQKQRERLQLERAAHAKYAACPHGCKRGTHELYERFEDTHRRATFACPCDAPDEQTATVRLATLEAARVIHREIEAELQIQNAAAIAELDRTLQERAAKRQGALRVAPRHATAQNAARAQEPHMVAMKPIPQADIDALMRTRTGATA